MTDLEIILTDLKASHYKPWDANRLEECKALLKYLSKDDLRAIRHSRWMDMDNPLYPSLFEALYRDELSATVEKLKKMETKSLLEELRTTKSAYKKEKIPEILLERYDRMSGQERKDVFRVLLRKGLVEKE